MLTVQIKCHYKNILKKGIKRAKKNQKPCIFLLLKTQFFTTLLKI